MLLAVLHRHAGIACFDQDVFVNAVGGVKITEPGADLAVLLAIVSSLRNKPLPEKMVVFGEVGLAGEVRPVQRGQERLKEAAKLGFVRPSCLKPICRNRAFRVLRLLRWTGWRTQWRKCAEALRWRWDGYGNEGRALYIYS